MASGERDRPEVSVVIVTRNGERRLPYVLSQLRQQSLDPSRYELVVVDDGSSDGSAGLARSYGARVISLPESRGPAAARNAGAYAANGEIIVFTDDDCEPEEDWLETLLSAFVEDSLDGVSGHVVPVCDNRFLLGYLESRNPLTPLGIEYLKSTGWVDRLGRYCRDVLGRGQGLLAGSELCSIVGANSAVRRALIVELGGFDEAIVFSGEEEDLCRRAHSRSQGAVFRFVPAAVVKHRFDPSLRDSLRRSRAYGRGHPHAATSHADVKPIVYPLPVAIVLVSAMAVRSRRRRWLALVALAPIAAYPRWPVRAWRSRSVTSLLYPYLELAEETATMIGELEGLGARRGRGKGSRTTNGV